MPLRPLSAPAALQSSSWHAGICALRGVNVSLLSLHPNWTPLVQILRCVEGCGLVSLGREHLLSLGKKLSSGKDKVIDRVF